MSNFKQFKEDFNQVLEDKFEGDLFELMYNEPEEFPLEGELVENKDSIEYDSYGSEDSTLERIYHFPKYDIYVMFYGTRSSYEGEDWDGFKEVKKIEKIINVWE